MKTIRSIKPETKYTNSELMDIISENIDLAGEPCIVGAGRSSERIIFPDTQNGSYVLSIKCNRRINVYLGEYVAPNPKKPIAESFYSEMTYWRDRAPRRTIYDLVERVTDELTRLLLGEDADND